jgi:hypothetical protein
MVLPVCGKRNVTNYLFTCVRAGTIYLGAPTGAPTIFSARRSLRQHCTQSTASIHLTSAANGHLGTSRITGPTSPTLTAIDPYNIQSLGRKPWHLIVLPSSPPKNGPRNLLTSNRTRGTASTCGSGRTALSSEQIGPVRHLQTSRQSETTVCRPAVPVLYPTPNSDK